MSCFSHQSLPDMEMVARRKYLFGVFLEDCQIGRMSAQKSRAYAWIGVTIVIGAVIISAALISSFSLQKTVTSTSATTTVVVTSNSNMTETITIAGYDYLSNHCAAPGGATYVGPCYSPSIADAAAINCAAAAATPEGCTQRVFINRSSTASFVVKVNYPVSNIKNGLPGDNCEFSILFPSGTAGPGPAYCIPLNSTAFYISEQHVVGPPP